MAGSVGKGRAALRASPKRYSGTDPPLSLAGPTLADLQRTTELEKVIRCLCLRFAALTALLGFHFDDVPVVLLKNLVSVLG